MFYQEYTGRNRICCNNKLIGGSQIKSLVFSLALINLPTIIYIIFSTEFLFTYDTVVLIFTIILIVLMILTDISLIIVFFTEPGIIPSLIWNDRIDKKYKNTQDEKHEKISYIILINNSLNKLKFCETCKIFRPI